MTPRTAFTNVASTSAEDARFERTRVKLTEAVLELASEQGITTTSVAELTRRAQINRSTFYSHAASPVQLLTRVLSQDLDDVRRRTAEQLDRDGLLLRDVTRATLQEIINHVTTSVGSTAATKPERELRKLPAMPLGTNPV